MQFLINKIDVLHATKLSTNNYFNNATTILKLQLEFIFVSPFNDRECEREIC